MSVVLGRNGGEGGRLYGVGLGPGDPELVTVKAVRLIEAAPVIAYFAKRGRSSNARQIAARWIKASPSCRSSIP